MNKNLIIYDGECGFCNKIMIFIAKKDKNNHYKFVSNTSKIAREILDQKGMVEVSEKTIIVMDNNEIFIKGKAIKVIAKNIVLNPILKRIIAITNEKLLNIGYTIIAKNRLLLTNNSCEIPPKEVLEKFIF